MSNAFPYTVVDRDGIARCQCCINGWQSPMMPLKVKAWSLKKSFFSCKVEIYIARWVHLSGWECLTRSKISHNWYGNTNLWGHFKYMYLNTPLHKMEKTNFGNYYLQNGNFVVVPFMKTRGIVTPAFTPSATSTGYADDSEHSCVSCWWEKDKHLSSLMQIYAQAAKLIAVIFINGDW